MTPRRFVLYTAALATPYIAMWAAHALDHLCGWYDPRRRT